MTEIATTIIGLIGGVLTFYVTNGWIEKRRENISTLRTQLEKVIGPLEVLMRINGREFERYFSTEASDADREFIEQHVWYPNNTEIKRILLGEAHVLPELPKELLDLMAHIIVWLSEYDLVYNRKTKKPPVFAGPKGYGYPKAADAYVYGRANELRKAVNK